MKLLDNAEEIPALTDAQGQPADFLYDVETAQVYLIVKVLTEQWVIMKNDQGFNVMRRRDGLRILNERTVKDLEALLIAAEGGTSLGRIIDTAA